MEKTTKSRTHNKVRPLGRKEIDIALLFRALLKKLWLIILVTVLAAGVTFAGAKLFITPQYRSVFTAYINNKNDVEHSSLTSSDVMASKSLAHTYSEIICCRYVLNTAAESVGLEYRYSRLKRMVSVSISSETEIITINVDTNDPVLSLQLAEAIRDTSLKYTAEIVEASSMKIVDNPEMPTGISSPNYTRLALLGAVLGFILTVLIICIRQYFNDRIMSETDLEERYTLPVVGIIPDMMNTDKGKGGYYYYYGHSDSNDGKDTEKGA